MEGKNIKNVDKSIIQVEEFYEFTLEMQKQMKGGITRDEGHKNFDVSKVNQLKTSSMYR